jgi:hypothetical protein
MPGKGGDPRIGEVESQFGTFFADHIQDNAEVLVCPRFGILGAISELLYNE